MRLEDNMMPVLTGLVFAVVLGTTVQNSDDLMKAFGASERIEAADDVFFVRAGTDARLDVLANDTGHATTSEEGLHIVTGPTCGEVTPGPDGITYSNSANCEGHVHFTYCLGSEDLCDAADVTMQVRPAPVALADAYLPEKGDVVPLRTPVLSQAPVSSNEATSEGKQPVLLHAFVVSLAPEENSLGSGNPQISRFMINLSAADLDKTPLNDGSYLANLRSVDVPLSASRTARFLAGHSGDLWSVPTDLAEPLGDGVERENPVETVEGLDETAQIKLKSSIFPGGTDQS